MTGSGGLGWTTLEFRPGQLVRWTNRTNIFITAPAVVSGIEVPAWWSTNVVLRSLRLGPDELARMDWCITEEMQRQQEQAQAARRVALEDRESRGPIVIEDDSDDGMDL